MNYREIRIGKRNFYSENGTWHVLPGSYRPWTGERALTEGEFTGILHEELEQGNVDMLVNTELKGKTFKKIQDPFGGEYMLRITGEQEKPAVLFC